MGIRQELVRQLKERKLHLALLFVLGYLVGHVLILATAAPDPNALKVQGADTFGNPLQVQPALPGAGGTVITSLGSSSNNAAAANNVSLGSAAGQSTYCSGFQITGAGATATSNIEATLTNVVGGTQRYKIVIPGTATISITPLIVTFNPPLQATGQNIQITLSVPSFGAGNTDAAAAIQGFRQ